MAEFFIEIGCEEIPAKMIPESLAAGSEILTQLLRNYRISMDPVAAYATPTRLIYHIPQLDEKEPDQTVRVQGPPKRICFDADGKPTRALQGFLKKTGLAQDDIRFEQGKSEEIAVADTFEKGRLTSDILLDVLPTLLKRIPFRKHMKWGDLDIRFVRPIRWLCALLDGKPLPLRYAGIQAGSLTRGHRILGRREIPVSSFHEYRDQLHANHVWIDPNARRASILDALAAFEKRHDATVIRDDELLNEVTYLVEEPLVVEGAFDTQFLDIPEEVLITSMKEHQKYFAARSRDGKLLPRFLAVASAADDPNGYIRKGNERVLAARLYDARFFWDEDRKTPLAARMEKLERQVFQQDLGSYADKLNRMQTIADKLCDATGADREKVRTTVSLCKCDLATDMVYEFPELQGIMGGLYAREEGQPESVWQGIYDHYRPGSMEDDLPRTVEGQLTAIADKLDTFLGCLAVGIIPTGSKDPFGLRRAAQGIVRIVMEKALTIDLYQIVRSCMPLYEPSLKLERDEWEKQVFSILDARVSFWLQSHGFAYDEIEAVLTVPHGQLVDTLHRITAVREARRNDDFLRVATSFKRVHNILGTASDTWPETVAPDKLDHPQAVHLFQAMEKLASDVQKHANRGRYLEALQAIAGIADSVDRFFDDVLVMDKDDTVRSHRLALLAHLRSIFLTVADFSRLVIGDNH